MVKDRSQLWLALEGLLEQRENFGKGEVVEYRGKRSAGLRWGLGLRAKLKSLTDQILENLVFLNQIFEHMELSVMVPG